MSRVRITLAALVAVLIAVTSLQGRAAVGGDSQFVGSWVGVHTPDAGGPPPFRTLFTIHQDGTVVESDEGPPTPHLFTAGHGAWEQVGKNEYLVTYLQLNFDEAANPTGTLKVRVQFKVNKAGTTMSGPAIVDFYDPDGNLVFSGGGSIAGSRILPEPLN